MCVYSTSHSIAHLFLDDQLFVPSGDSADEEETIEIEEESATKVYTVLLIQHCYLVNCQDGGQDYSSELAALQREGEMPIEDLLATLPEALLSENVSPLTPSSAEDEEEDNGMLTISDYYSVC